MLGQVRFTGILRVWKKGMRGGEWAQKLTTTPGTQFKTGSVLREKGK